LKKVTPRKQVNSPAQTESDLSKLSQPAQRALAAAGIHSFAQLTRFTEAEIKKLHGPGPNALQQLRQALTDKGLSFAGEQGNSGKSMKRSD
jgi:predicted flap endonuclease-1-like 5' DNA nuclease